MEFETVGTSGDFNRDGHGRPLIVMPGTGEILPHARVSTVAKLATNTEALAAWGERQTALAIAKSPDILAILSGLDDTRENWKTITGLVKEARARHGGNVAANWGTAIHLHTEHDARREFLPGFLRPDVESYDRELERTGIVPLESELRIANSAEDLMVAGTCDHLYRIPDGITAFGIDLSQAVVIGDKKAGKTMRSINIAAQLAGYSYGDRYDTVSDSRSPLHSDLCPHVGLGVHIPREKGMTAFTFVDLRVGRALLAAARFLHRHATGAGLTVEVPARDGIAARIAECMSRDDLMALWRSLGIDAQTWYRKAFVLRQARIG